MTGPDFAPRRRRPNVSDPDESAVVRKPMVVRRKLTVGASDDPAEREADAAAERVTAILRATPDQQPSAADERIESAVRAGRIARVAEIGAAGGEVDRDTEAAITAARSGGAQLDTRIRRQMEGAFGADFSGVRMHVGGRADDLAQRIQARAFTTGNDVFVRRQEYAPTTSAGQALIAHELAHTLQQRGAAVSRRFDSANTPTAATGDGAGVIRRYADVPTTATWKTDSNVARARRSDEVKAIDTALAEYDAVRASTDYGLKRKKMYLVLDYIRAWEKAKTPAGVAKSDRGASIAELKQILEAKVQENLDAHAIELAPLAAEYRQAAAAYDGAETAAKGRQLLDAHHELFPKTAAEALKTNDRDEWATIVFNAPLDAVGMRPFDPMTIKAKADYSWLSAAQADAAIENFILPSASVNKGPILQMLQWAPFRNALVANASAPVAAKLTAMPLVRIAMAAEQDAATKNGGVPSIEDIADSVFAAFLGDQPVSGLGYATNSTDFSTADFLLGSAAASKRAPCMTLSNMLTEIFRSVLPSGNPASMVNAHKDMVPLLTKPLATIGTGNGILTQEAAFSGNVERFGNVVGYANVNRIFFGDGHEWLVVGNREYDPTLGITGPIGTVRSQVENLTFTKKGEKYTASDGKVAIRNKHQPPGGAPLLFQRSVVIK